jgi:hypothetical protein
MSYYFYRKLGDENYKFWCEQIPEAIPPCFPDYIPLDVMACYKMTAWFGSSYDLCESDFSNEQCVICTTGIPDHDLSDDLEIFPNPADHISTIRFTICSKTYINLKISDIIGQSCLTIVDKVLPPGTHEVDFPVTGLSPGIYYCTLTSEESRKTKMLIVSNR